MAASANGSMSVIWVFLSFYICIGSSPKSYNCIFYGTKGVEDCRGWEILPSLESLSSLTKLKLRNMPELVELSIPSLEELLLIDMPKLDRCLSSSVRDLNSSLRVLEIRRCWVLKALPLFESCEKFEIEQKSWLPNVSELTIHDCPHLMVSNPLPPSSSFCKLSIPDMSTLPTMEGSSNGELGIGFYGDPSSILFPDTFSFFFLFLDDKVLSFHNLRTITRLKIVGCLNLFSISLEGFRQLICLKRLEIKYCEKLFSSDVPLMQAHEDMTTANFDALPSLEYLSIQYCGITGGWLSVMLQHVQALEELHLVNCEQITGLLIDGKQNSLSNLTLAAHASSQGNLDGASTWSCPDELLRVPSNLVSSLKKMSIEFCGLKLRGNKEGFSEFTSLEELKIVNCPELIPSLVHGDEINDQANGRWLLPCSLGILYIGCSSLETLQPCFPGDLTRLTVLKVSLTSKLKSLQLHSCTALEKLTITCCESLDALEGVHSLRSLRYLDVWNIPRLKSLPQHACTTLEELTIADCRSLDELEGVQSLCNLSYLEVYRCPGLPQCLENLSTQSYELCPRLESLQINDYSFLNVPFWKQLTSLQCLQFKCCGFVAVGLTDEQETALQLLTSLQQLRFDRWYQLSDLLVGLHSLLSLKQLEELEVQRCSKELTEQCRMLATSKLKLKIDGEYVN